MSPILISHYTRARMLQLFFHCFDLLLSRYYKFVSCKYEFKSKHIQYFSQFSTFVQFNCNFVDFTHIYIIQFQILFNVPNSHNFCFIFGRGAFDVKTAAANRKCDKDDAAIIIPQKYYRIIIGIMVIFILYYFIFNYT